MELNELLAQVDALKAEIDSLRPLKPEVEHRVMQKFRLDWNYHSNAIEGNSLTLGETRAFLMEGLTADGKPLKDHLDIKGHNELITFLELFVQRKEQLTEAAIREMHGILLHEPYDMEAVTLDGKIVRKRVRLGEYKQTENFVRTATGEIHRYATPDDVPPKMDELIRWHRERQEKMDVHPLVHASLFHHRFLAIHPFDDGNGRLGRILMNLVLMQHGFPPVVVKLAERDRYVAALRRADSGEPNTNIAFVGQKLLDAEILYLRGGKGESIDDADDVEKAVALLKQERGKKSVPPSFSPDIQKEHFEQYLVPLLRRVDAKLNQFNDLFAKATIDVFYHYEDGAEHRWSGDFTGTLNLLAQITTKGRPLSALRFGFKWDGFLLDGTNDFTVWLWFGLEYKLRKFSFAASDANLEREFLYRTWFTGDELSDLIAAFGKVVLRNIEQRRSKPKTA